MIIADTHTHCEYSADSGTPILHMAQGAASKGLSVLCHTEHQDLGTDSVVQDSGGLIFLLDTDSYKEGFAEHLITRPPMDLEELWGVECGMMPETLEESKAYVHSHDFDYVIGSLHFANRHDPYYPAFFESISEKEALRLWFEETYRNIQLFDDFDSLGHLDYIIRYMPSGMKSYNTGEYGEIIDAVLEHLIKHGKALECNTASLRKGVNDFNPCRDIWKRYKELGGELLTVGSDAHVPEDIAADFDKAEQMLIESGFTHYCIYRKRQLTQYAFR